MVPENTAEKEINSFLFGRIFGAAYMCVIETSTDVYVEKENGCRLFIWTGWRLTCAPFQNPFNSSSFFLLLIHLPKILLFFVNTENKKERRNKSVGECEKCNMPLTQITRVFMFKSSE